MGLPVLAVENLGSIVQFPSHTLVGTEEPSGTEAYHVADGRRSSFDYWQPTTTNTPMYLTISCDRVRSANFVALDRAHNLAGKQIIVECSQDNFTTVETVLNVTALPSASSPGSIDDPLGVRTEEGAWLARFPLRSAQYWRLNVPAMGASLRPKVVGLWIGLSWETAYFWDPYSDEAQELVQRRVESYQGWLGATPGTRRRTYEITIKLMDFLSYDQARYHIGGHFGAGRPMWIIHDQGQADRALLALRNGKIEWKYLEDWGYLQAVIPWIEHEPALSA